MFFRKNKSPSTLSDEELILKYKETSDSALFGELFKRYTPFVFGVCMKYLKDQEESKDAVMVIFEKLMDDLKKHSVTNFKAWLHMVSRNNCLMQLRQHKSSNIESVSDSLPDLVMESEEDLHLFIEKEGQLQKMEASIQCLSEEQRVCVQLFFLKEKTYQEVCDETGYTMNQVKSFLQNGKRNLKIILQRHHAE
ncbi:MAG TPA: sigma-70 family RNA polymerase sigma factor [Cytophagaceae bacterium]|jgi:RNA polymerase sigma-70 factor (ECF subfamily)